MISITASTLLFELSGTQAALFDQNTDREDLVARIVTLTASGVSRARPSGGSVSKLVQSSNTNRAPDTGCDPGDCILSVSPKRPPNRPVHPCGVGSWVLPSVRDLTGPTPYDHDVFSPDPASN
jgi:hypothetical protein